MDEVGFRTPNSFEGFVGVAVDGTGVYVVGAVFPGPGFYVVREYDLGGDALWDRPAQHSCRSYISLVKSDTTVPTWPGSVTPKARSISDHRSSRPTAADPVDARFSVPSGQVGRFAMAKTDGSRQTVRGGLRRKTASFWRSPRPS